MDENNKIQSMAESMADFSSMLGETEQLLTDAVNRVNNNQNAEYHDDYEDFTEFEDENGKIMLIKYSPIEYEYRGNKYCKYILCNEKTGSREEGIAQIKNGQYSHITDIERINKIDEYIKHNDPIIVKDCKDISENPNYFYKEWAAKNIKTTELECIGWKIIPFKDVLALYQIAGNNKFYSDGNGTWYMEEDEGDFYVKYLLHSDGDPDCNYLEYVDEDIAEDIYKSESFHRYRTVHFKNRQIEQITQIHEGIQSKKEEQNQKFFIRLAKFFKR